jgi:plasmid stabilization system protein ParE
MARYRVRFARAALEDLVRLADHLVAHESEADPEARLRDAVAVLERLPFVGRRAEGAGEQGGSLRELVVPAGSSGYVLLYRVGPGATVSVLAARHQREEQYH